jgi:hypothetical protein
MYEFTINFIKNIYSSQDFIQLHDSRFIGENLFEGNNLTAI